MAFAYRCTWAGAKSDIRLDPSKLRKLIRGRGLGRDVGERIVRDLSEWGFLERHQPEPLKVGGKYYSQQAVDKLLPSAIADHGDYRVVERSWFKGQFSLEELAALLFLRAGTGDGPQTYRRELKERFGWVVRSGASRTVCLSPGSRTHPWTEVMGSEHTHPARAFHR